VLAVDHHAHGQASLGNRQAMLEPGDAGHQRRPVAWLRGQLLERQPAPVTYFDRVTRRRSRNCSGLRAGSMPRRTAFSTSSEVDG